MSTFYSQVKLDYMDTNYEVVNGKVSYHLNVGGEKEKISINDCLGNEIRIQFRGNIYCENCQRKISKTYGGGYCFPCMRKLAKCDMCYIKPELCHFHKGTCREEEWAKEICFSPHVVYLSYTSTVKVGITRKNRFFHRWMDQGATMGCLLGEVIDRKTSGEIENRLKEEFDDKTNFRKMLLSSSYEQNISFSYAKALELIDKMDFNMKISEEKIYSLYYPVEKYLEKIKTLNLEKEKEYKGVLRGAKAQYLIFEDRVLNVKKYTGYEVDLEIF